MVQPNGTSWHKLAQVEQVEQVEAGLQIYVGQVGQEQGVCPAEPLHLTHVEQPGRGAFECRGLRSFQNVGAPLKTCVICTGTPVKIRLKFWQS